MSSTELLKLFTGTPEQRIQAIFHLLTESDDKSIQIIAHSLHNDPSPIVRHEAAYILGEKDNILAIHPLINAIQNDTAEIVVHESALALANLGQLGYPESRTVLSALLKSSDENIVDTAEIALQRLEMKVTNQTILTDLSSIQKILLDKSPQNKERRIQASFILSEDASTKSVELLIEALHKEPSPIVKHELIFSLGEAIHHKVVQELQKVLESDENFFCLHESLLALGTIGDQSADQIIRKFLKHENPEIVESAQIGLERLLS